jgi:hypothetical protein
VGLIRCAPARTPSAQPERTCHADNHITPLVDPNLGQGTGPVRIRRSGLEVSEAKQFRALEDENGRLKRMLADAMLDNAALKDLLGKKR